MAIAYDASSSYSNSAWQFGSSLTWAHTCTGSNRYLVVSITVGDATTDQLTGITYGGVSMLRLGYYIYSAASRGVWVYGLANPATGANNIVASFSATKTYIDGRAVSYTDVKQTDQPDSSNTGFANIQTSISVATTTVADNSWVVGAFHNSSANTNSRTGITSRQYNTGTGCDLGDSNGVVTPAGSYTITEGGASAGNWVGVVVSLSPFAASTQNSNFLALF